MNREKFQKTDLRRSCLHLRLILSTDSAYTTNNTDQKKKKKERMNEKNQIQTPANAEEGEESNLQSYHIIRFKSESIQTNRNI